VTCTNGLVAASAVTWRPCPLRPVPRGLASGGGKVEGNPGRRRPGSRTYPLPRGRTVIGG
jgi:hypothetical protein